MGSPFFHVWWSCFRRGGAYGGLRAARFGWPIAGGDCAVAHGERAIACGCRRIACCGRGCVCCGCGVARGCWSTTSGDRAVAYGDRAIAYGDRAIAYECRRIAYGDCAIAYDFLLFESSKRKKVIGNASSGDRLAWNKDCLVGMWVRSARIRARLMKSRVRPSLSCESRMVFSKVAWGGNMPRKDWSVPQNLETNNSNRHAAASCPTPWSTRSLVNPLH